MYEKDITKYFVDVHYYIIYCLFDDLQKYLFNQDLLVNIHLNDY